MQVVEGAAEGEGGEEFPVHIMIIIGAGEEGRLGAVVLAEPEDDDLHLD
jgi:hypothetical protein